MIAFAFAQEKSNVSICARNEKILKDTASEIKNKTGSNVLAIPIDLTDKKDIEKLIQRTVEEFGTIDVLINNTGGPPPKLFENTTDEQWNIAVQQLLLSTINCCLTVLPYMKKQFWGRIINMTSIAAKQPIHQLILSNTIRSGILGYTKTLSNELAKYGILVNAVCPGYTLTERVEELAKSLSKEENLSYKNIICEWEKNIPLGRLAKPEEIANIVVFLASEKSSYMTGNVIQVDGGYYRGII
jgi:3-oxoacyl-[acyl-carrier protein] reductase